MAYIRPRYTEGLRNVFALAHRIVGLLSLALASKFLKTFKSFLKLFENLKSHRNFFGSFYFRYETWFNWLGYNDRLRCMATNNTYPI